MKIHFVTVHINISKEGKTSEINLLAKLGVCIVFSSLVNKKDKRSFVLS